MTLALIGKLVMQVVKTKNLEEYLLGLIGELKVAVKEVIKRYIEIEKEVTQALKPKQHGPSKGIGSGLME